jgi:hypothetical protein
MPSENKGLRAYSLGPFKASATHDGTACFFIIAVFILYPGGFLATLPRPGSLALLLFDQQVP